ncbi:MAG: hypothetical protein J0J01_31380 [Reyranella sp.]|uniref:hypothetical protein n=1 Tax=Reyranella sp. TaxID=1929291 RepID=UPI001AC376F8|nr:hypothetical protein [Reyranella sp.]MBN9091444.1 hypothetical protein [Reyranella sp.]
MSANKPPVILDKIADLILAYRPKPKSKGAKKRKKAAKKLAEAASQHFEEVDRHIAAAREEIDAGARPRKRRFRL